jgi:hypothetical protein
MLDLTNCKPMHTTPQQRSSSSKLAVALAELFLMLLRCTPPNCLHMGYSRPMCYMPNAQPHDQAMLLTVHADVGCAGLGSSFPGYDAQSCAASAACHSSSP